MYCHICTVYVLYICTVYVLYIYVLSAKTPYSQAPRNPQVTGKLDQLRSRSPYSTTRANTSMADACTILTSTSTMQVQIDFGSVTQHTMANAGN